METQIKFHGFDPSTSLIQLYPRKGETTLRTEDILGTIEKEGDSIALVLLSGVQYYTGWAGLTLRHVLPRPTVAYLTCRACRSILRN